MSDDYKIGNEVATKTKFWENRREKATVTEGQESGVFFKEFLERCLFGTSID